MINFKYGKPLNDASCIDKFENEFGYKFSSDFIECVKTNNGGRPLVKTFDTSSKSDRTIKKLLSFNKCDEENIWILNEILRGINDTVIAFAIDSFGNYICFSKKDHSVTFFESETESVGNIADSFSAFLEKLH